MRKYLSIIVPRYKETEKDLFPLLASIETQIGVDFGEIEVIISNDGDGGEKLNDDFFSIFSFDVRQVFLKENKGPGVARQEGLDNAKGTYVMFIDADDMLHNVAVLDAMMQEIDRSAPDILCTSWIEQVRNDQTGEFSYVTHENENTWMFGKMLRRKFLTENNLRFHDKLRVHEDSYILSIARSITDRNVFLPITSYLWKFREDSITRINGGIYTYNSIPVFIEALTMAHKESESRGVDITHGIIQFICYIFFTIHSDGWYTEEHDKYRLESEKAFKANIKPFMHYWVDNEDMRKVVFNEERARIHFNGIENETVTEWLKRLKLTQ